MTAAWKAEKDQVQDTQKLKERLDQARVRGGSGAAPRRPRPRVAN